MNNKLTKETLQEQNEYSKQNDLINGKWDTTETLQFHNQRYQVMVY